MKCFVRNTNNNYYNCILYVVFVPCEYNNINDKRILMKFTKQ